MSVGIVIDGDKAKVALAFIVQGRPQDIETIITTGGERWRVTGWDQERQAFECERIDTGQAKEGSE